MAEESQKIQTYKIVRSPNKKTVSGLYTDKELAKDKVKELNDKSCMTYTVKKGAKIKGNRLV